MTTRSSRAPIGVLAFLSFAFVASTAHAGAPVTPPPEARTPGAAQQTVEPKRTIPIDRGVQLPELIGSEVQPPPVPPGGTPVNVARFEFSGNTKITSQALQAKVADKVGRSMTLAEIYAIARDLTRYYQSQGYPLASVNVPQQRVDSGTVRLEVREGRIGQVRIEGQRYYKQESLAKQLSELKSGDVVSSATLERELLLLNDLPGIEARVVILPGSEPGTSDLLVKITEDSFSFHASGDNYGRTELGTARFSVSAAINGMGRGDMLEFAVTHSESDILNYGRIGYSMPVGTDGGRVGFSYFINRYQIGFNPLLSPVGQTDGLRAEYTYPLERSRKANRVLAVGYGSTNLTTEALGTVLTDQRVQLFDLTLFGSKIGGDRDTTNYSLGVTSSFGFDDGGNDRSYCCNFLAEYATTAPVGSGQWFTRYHVRAGYAPTTLSDIEKFSIGGPNSVRGYDATEIRGDNGIEMNFELHRGMRAFGGQADVAMFADFGMTGKTSSIAGNAGGALDHYIGGQSPVLGSVGLKFTAFDFYGFNADLQYAVPMGGYEPADGKSGQFFVSLSTFF